MHRAEPPRTPPPTPALEYAEERRKAYLAGREKVQARSIYRGLILLAMLVLLASMAHAGFGRVFAPGWWKP